MRPKLPEFPSPTTEQLRAIYARSDQDVRNVVLEVIRLRQLIVEADAYRETVEKCWQEEGLGQLVALYQFRLLMQTERSMMGFISEYRGKEPNETSDESARRPDNPTD
jgi:hypothetical protein